MTGPPGVRLLPWDSGHFGFPIATVESHRPTEGELERAVSNAESRNVKCLYFLCDSDLPGVAAAAGRLGFELVDLRVTLARMLNRGSETGSPDSSPGLRVRRASVADLERLRPLARSSFHQSRFFVDPRFPRAAVEDLFTIWVDRDVVDPRGLAVVVEKDGELAGFATGLVDETGGRIQLVAVSENARGAGVGKAAVQALLSGFMEGGSERISVVTQGRNAGAIRLYETTGFRMLSIQLWFHRWS